MWSVAQMYHAPLPKTDYRDKGRGHDRRLLWRQPLTLASKKKLNYLVNNLSLYDYDAPDKISRDGQSAVDRDTSKFVAL